MALERELEVFARELPHLLADPTNLGRFVLIGGDPPTVTGVFGTAELGLDAGYKRFELAPFLVKLIAEREEPLYFSRNVRCRT